MKKGFDVATVGQLMPKVTVAKITQRLMYSEW